MSVVIETNDSICTIIINRAEVKNAVDGPTAIEPADAFRKFEQDESLQFAKGKGRHGTF